MQTSSVYVSYFHGLAHKDDVSPDHHTPFWDLVFQDGDVLVTARTDPDWEPIMRRAGAIVTDQGGRTCHAAIIARELGIPAIVGTANATGGIIRVRPNVGDAVVAIRELGGDDGGPRSIPIRFGALI